MEWKKAIWYMVVEYVTIQTLFLWYNIKRCLRFVLEMVELFIHQNFANHHQIFKYVWNKEFFFQKQDNNFSTTCTTLWTKFQMHGKKSTEIILLLFVKMLCYTW